MGKEQYRSRYEAYPFLSDDPDDLRCDFEILTDEISCRIGLLRSMADDMQLKDELLKICELVYHINPSLRTFVSVTEDELKWLEDRTSELREEVKDRCNKFVLNQGDMSACEAHIIRTEFKSLVRMLYRHMYNGNEVTDILFDFTNLLSGYFFYLALKMNKTGGIDEIEFVSRNYR
jgi:ATP:cob(I)alamin adenosyltransferase